MTKLLLKNRASSTLQSSATAGDTTLTVADASILPLIDAAEGEYFYATIIELGEEDTPEIVKVTDSNVATDVLTVVRGFEGTAPRVFSAGAVIEQRITVATLKETVRYTAVIHSDATPPEGTPVLVVGADNQLQTSISYKMPLASSVRKGDICIVSMSKKYEASRPSVSTDGADTFADDSGSTETVIDFLGPVTVKLTSDGISSWEVSLSTASVGAKGEDGTDGISVPTEVVTEIPVSPVAGTLYIVVP